MKCQLLLLNLAMILMAAFIPINGYAEGVPSSNYLLDRLAPKDKRYSTMLHALELLRQRSAKVVVETGTSRMGDKNFVGDGGSTIIFGDWAHQNGAVFFSVDIDPKAVAEAKAVVEAYGQSVNVVCQDSIAFLKNFTQPIDFLYLDSFDFETKNPFPSQEHHLKEIKAAYPLLHDQSVVMIDDCGLPRGGKGLLVIDYLKRRGWKVLHSAYQTILTR